MWGSIILVRKSKNCALQDAELKVEPQHINYTYAIGFRISPRLKDLSIGDVSIFRNYSEHYTNLITYAWETLLKSKLHIQRDILSIIYMYYRKN